ncbi:NAD(+) synthase [Natronorubrum sp. DTA28]|uniref:NAD(+) synthase n=1 Tax=Natronorubrum sp. DTA28 TaxID=3447019 RepID=UPI003F864F55
MTDDAAAVGRTRADGLPRDDDGLAIGSDALARLQEVVPAFIEEQVDDAGADGVVIALDGELASTVTATLAVDALGSDRVTGLVLPAYMNQEAAARDAEAIASVLGIEYSRVPLQPLLAAFQEVVGATAQPADDLVAMENVAARLRMACSYYVANTTNALVVGTATRTDRFLGTLTKHADTGVDCLPLGDLYATEVRVLADALEIPTDLVAPSASPGVGAGQSAGDELEIEPKTVDRVLRLSVDEGVDVAAVAERVGVDAAAVERIADWYASMRHKRQLPPTPATRAGSERPF